MGKITFRRATGKVRPQAMLASSLPVLGATCFLIGSCFFWPNLYAVEGYGVLAASLFTLGSVFFMAAPLIDYIDMTYGIESVRSDPGPGKEAAHLEWLYLQQMVRTQRANTILYFVGSICFVVGSILFYPSMRSEATHGAWLYLTGCAIVLLGAMLAAFTALELRKTAKVHTYARQWWSLHWWSDEDAQVFSCSAYMVGNACFIAGSICFFPKLTFLGEGALEGFIEDERISEYAAAVLFIVGSACLLCGSVVDFLALVREHTDKADRPSVTEVTEASALVQNKAKRCLGC